MSATAAFFLATAMLVVTGVTHASAQDAQRFDDGSAGLRVVAVDSIYDGGASTVVPLPNLGFGTTAFTVAVEGLRLNMFDDDTHRVEALLRPRFAPYGSSDSPQLAGMERDFTADLGLRYAYTTPFDTQVSMIGLSEVTQEHRGQEVELRVSQGLEPGGLPLAVYVGGVWRSEDLSMFLYGVHPSEARAGRAAYDAGETFTPFIGISTYVPVTARFSLTAGVRTEILPSDIRDSPIVVDEAGVSGTAGFLWRF